MVKNTAEFFGDSIISFMRIDVDDFIKLFNFYIDSLNESEDEKKQIEKSNVEEPMIISRGDDGFFDL